ncbi:SA1362 family protein [Robertmurraya sp. Marseille-Q9965]
MAFLKNRTSFYFVIGMIILAIIGVASRFISNPTAFFQSVLVFLVIGFVIFFLVRRFNSSTPQKRDQSAFRRAAKKSKKRFQQKDARKPSVKTMNGNVSTLKKGKNKAKSAAHLTVIEGKKGKKKKRASF